MTYQGFNISSYALVYAGVCDIDHVADPLVLGVVGSLRKTARVYSNASVKAGKVGIRSATTCVICGFN